MLYMHHTLFKLLYQHQPLTLLSFARIICSLSKNFWVLHQFFSSGNTIIYSTQQLQVKGIRWSRCQPNQSTILLTAATKPPMPIFSAVYTATMAQWVCTPNHDWYLIYCHLTKQSFAITFSLSDPTAPTTLSLDDFKSHQFSLLSLRTTVVIQKTYTWIHNGSGRLQWINKCHVYVVLPTCEMLRHNFALVVHCMSPKFGWVWWGTVVSVQNYTWLIQWH